MYDLVQRERREDEEKTRNEKNRHIVTGNPISNVSGRVHGTDVRSSGHSEVDEA
jgi:hypothetical protein